MTGLELIDTHKRRLNYLRVSITDRCNLNCLYCEPRKRIELLSHDDILRYEEMERLVRVFLKLGVDKVRVTGGEPLVRRGVCAFLARLSSMDGLTDLSLTTNGVMLEDKIPGIKSAGVRRINISLDTLDRKKFERITGMDRFDAVWRGIVGAHEAGMAPVKINTVVMAGINDDEICDLARLSFSYPFHIRFIEYMPVGNCSVAPERPLLAPEIMERLVKLGKLSPVDKGPSDGPARRLRFEGAEGEIGLISAMSHHFCSECNRLRLTASGSLRTCLMSDNSEDLKTPMRKGCSDEELARLIRNAVRRKPSEHHLSADSKQRAPGRMSSIGG